MTARRLTNEDWGLDSFCYVCEPRNEHGLHLEMWADDEVGEVWADFSFDRRFSGAPTLVHGGVSLAVLDEVQAWAVIALAHRWAVTIETTSRFPKAVRLDTPYRAVARVTGTDGDVITTAATIETAKGLVCVESEARFQPIAEAVAVSYTGVEVAEENRSFLAPES